MKKIIGIVLVMVMILSLGIACTNEPAEEPVKETVESENTSEEAPAETELEVREIRVGYHTNLGGAGCVITAEKMGYFAEQGLVVELVPFTSGPPEIAAMASGDLQFAYIGNGAHALAINGQAEIISPLQIGNSEKLIARKDSGIETMEDLKGKKIATTFGTSGEVVVDLALAKAGLERGTGADQVEVINMETGGAVTAIISGQVDAVCVWEQYMVAVIDGLGENSIVLAQTADFQDEFIAISSYLATDKLIEEDPELVQRFVNALQKALKYQAANKEEAAAWVAELIDVDLETIMAGIDNASFITPDLAKEMLEDGSMDAIFQLQQDKFIEAEKVDGLVPLDEYLHYEFLIPAIEFALADE